jgi:hypothetical protein
MSDWFSNRGQIVQVVAATLAVALALFAAVKQDYIKVELAVAVVLCTASLLYFLFRSYESAASESSAALPIPTTTSSHTALLSEKSTATWSSETMRLHKGERWTDEGKKNAVTLVDVRSSSSGAKAIVSVRAELNNYCVGSDVEREGTNFVLPESTFHDQNAVVVSYTVSKFVLCFSVRADHVNSHTNEVDFVITKISG